MRQHGCVERTQYEGYRLGEDRRDVYGIFYKYYGGEDRRDGAHDPLEWWTSHHSQGHFPNADIYRHSSSREHA